MRNIVLIVLVIIVIGGVVYFVNRPIVESNRELSNLTEETDNQKSDSAGLPVTNTNNEVNKSQPDGYIAGNESLLLEVSEQNYQQAQDDGKLVVLYFYANWCPICREEFEDTKAVFEQLSDPNVIGFRVNYNDNETNDFERSLASQHGVAYQHTKVFVRNGEQLLKGPDSWEEGRYLEEINKYL